MNEPYLSDPIQTQDGWEASFAFQIFHRPSDEWLRMRWGFNAGALLDEALDRQKLFVESQSINEEAFFTSNEPYRTLVLRGMNLPGTGVQMALLGKVTSHDLARARIEAQSYAREISSIFPHDFLVRPAESLSDYHRLLGTELFIKNPSVALIERAHALIPAAPHGARFIGLWQSSARASEQIWRALSAMRQVTIFNVVMQPSVLYEEDKSFLLDLKKKAGSMEKDAASAPALISWMDAYVKRRLAAWKKFFLLQVHVLADCGVDDNLIRSIGSALVRDTNDMPLPGFSVSRPNSVEEEKNWRKHVQALDFIPPPMMLADLADLDEAFSVFRFPYRPEAGLPGADFVNP